MADGSGASSTTRGVSPYGKGLAMQYGSTLDLERDKRTQEMGLDRMKADSQFRIESLRNSIERQKNKAEEEARRLRLLAEQRIADTRFQYARMALQNKRRQQQYRNLYMHENQQPDFRLQSMLLAGLMKDF